MCIHGFSFDQFPFQKYSTVLYKNYYCTVYIHKKHCVQYNPKFFSLDTERPEILPFFFPKEVKEGHPLQVGCNILSGDEPITLQWYKDDIPLMSSANTVINTVSSRISLLVITGAKSEHSGTYSCKAFNPVGEAEFSASLQVMGKILIV